MSRDDVLRHKGSNPGGLDRLLNDGQKWIGLRSILQDQVKKANSFVEDYCKDHGDIEDQEKFLQRLFVFSDTVGRKISQLDDTSKELIQMEFNLVSINEARRSTSTSKSMKRLSWITVKTINISHKDYIY
ncbi:hypothetical protein N0V83_005392 [Neocucurbitaria cava]|uniref:Uncharacterized protein n=1 Tax=Neocucurbitaria cava TaxID=798079 RepID=A0A9W8Y6Z5_9PLEO|nr:hypothetical protein N0V83_005392 [Neocucurbitaria cava]